MNPKELRAAQQFIALHGYVKRCALRAAPLPDFVDDIAQQVFIEFITHADRWDMDSDLRPLLAKITNNIAGKYWREHLKTLPPMLARLAEKIAYLKPETLSAPEKENEREELIALRKCVERLPAKSGKLIRSYYYEQIPTETLAEQMKMKAESVNRAVSRTREKLRDCIRRTLRKEGRDVR